MQLWQHVIITDSEESIYAETFVSLFYEKYFGNFPFRISFVVDKGQYGLRTCIVPQKNVSNG